MKNSLGLLPSGKIRCFSGDDSSPNEPDLARISKAFLQKNASEGLVALTTLKSGALLPPTFRFWYEFACQYMATRCHSPDGEALTPLEPLEEADAEHFLMSAPPMQGAEYLSVPVLRNLWLELDDWLCQEVEQNFDGLAALLKARAPHWHQVGRVCFHLAENKKDPDYPFAFIATYSPSYARGRSRHLPLGRALVEYAGNKNKARLIQLLSPIDLASRSSALIKDLVDSGDVYHPLAWSPQQAYRFLKEVPLFEASGIVVRLPDWWKKRPKPLVKAILSTGLKNTFNTDDMLRFNVRMALGELELTEVEWDALLASDDGLLLIKGQWVEVDKEKLEAHSKIVLTGTPVENRLSDLWSLFDFICPGLLGASSRFKSFTKSLEQRASEQYAPLRNLVQPYILRRLKTDKSIISDLPDKTEVYAYCGLTKEQAGLYQKSVNELASAMKIKTGIQRRGLILSFILRFKQICNHPAQHLSDGNYSPRKSGKFLRLAEICEEIDSRQEKVLVFTQFREMCEPLADFLSSCFNRPGLVLHGAVPANKRQRMVEQFQAEEGPPFFVLSIKAGGTGLTLTAASHVVHFDRWWNPAVENQATDRAFRIGQKKNVLVHKFVCQGTIEEKIDAIIAEKSMLANELLQGGSEVPLTEMSDHELMNLVSLDLERVQTLTDSKDL